MAIFNSFLYVYQRVIYQISGPPDILIADPDSPMFSRCQISQRQLLAQISQGSLKPNNNHLDKFDHDITLRRHWNDGNWVGVPVPKLPYFRLMNESPPRILNISRKPWVSRGIWDHLGAVQYQGDVIIYNPKNMKKQKSPPNWLSFNAFQVIPSSTSLPAPTALPQRRPLQRRAETLGATPLRSGVSLGPGEDEWKMITAGDMAR